MKRYKTLLIAAVSLGLGVLIGAQVFPKTETIVETEYIKIPVEIIKYVEIERPEEIEPPEEVKQAIYVPSWSEEDAVILAKLVFGEAGGIPSDMEKAAVIWCVLNRVDAEGYACGMSIQDVVTYPNQFSGYNAKNPVSTENYELAVDVLTRWEREKAGEANVGRVLPADYMWFHGDGRHNHFRNEYKGGTRWDWSLPNPYET